MTPTWPLTSQLLMSHVWLYHSFIVSKSDGNTSTSFFIVVKASPISSFWSRHCDTFYMISTIRIRFGFLKTHLFKLVCSWPDHYHKVHSNLYTTPHYTSRYSISRILNIDCIRNYPHSVNNNQYNALNPNTKTHVCLKLWRQGISAGP